MIAIIDYGINETSELTKVLSELSVDFIVTRNERDIINCEKVIISNAPNLSKAIKRIHLFNLFSLLRFLKKPTLGIALGMELLCSKSEDGIACLGLFDANIIHDNSQTVCDGWKKLKLLKENSLFNGIQESSKFYFENSYHVNVNEYTIASANVENPFSAAIWKDNFYGVQFLPEKSGEDGIKLLNNFISIIN